LIYYEAYLSHRIYNRDFSFFWFWWGYLSGHRTITVTDSIAVADTVAASFKTDTVYSNALDIHDYDYIQFYCQLLNDSNFTNDSVVVKVQFSPSLETKDWQYVGNDSLFIFNSNDTSFGNVYRMDTMNVLSDLMRFECVRRDSNETTEPALLNNTYDASLVIRFKGWK